MNDLLGAPATRQVRPDDRRDRPAGLFERVVLDGFSRRR